MGQHVVTVTEIRPREGGRDPNVAAIPPRKVDQCRLRPRQTVTNRCKGTTVLCPAEQPERNLKVKTMITAATNSTLPPVPVARARRSVQLPDTWRIAGNTIPRLGAMLVVLITYFRADSGAHEILAVTLGSLCTRSTRARRLATSRSRSLAASRYSCRTCDVHLPTAEFSTAVRSGTGQWIAELYSDLLAGSFDHPRRPLALGAPVFAGRSGSTLRPPTGSPPRPHSPIRLSRLPAPSPTLLLVLICSMSRPSSPSYSSERCSRWRWPAGCFPNRNPCQK